VVLRVQIQFLALLHLLAVVLVGMEVPQEVAGVLVAVVGVTMEQAAQERLIKVMLAVRVGHFCLEMKVLAVAAVAQEVLALLAVGQILAAVTAGLV
jgi:hypothetical protein